MRATFADRLEKEGMSHLKRETDGAPFSRFGGYLAGIAHEFAIIGHE
jgi:hypothetical protein